MPDQTHWTFGGHGDTRSSDVKVPSAFSERLRPYFRAPHAELNQLPSTAALPAGTVVVLGADVGVWVGVWVGVGEADGVGVVCDGVAPPDVVDVFVGAALVHAETRREAETRRKPVDEVDMCPHVTREPRRSVHLFSRPIPRSVHFRATVWPQRRGQSLACSPPVEGLRSARMHRFLHFSCAGALVAATACGAKSELRTTGGDASVGGSGSSSASLAGSTTGSSSSTGGMVECNQLEAFEPVGIMPSGTVGVGRSPEIARSPDGFAYHVSIEPTSAFGDTLVMYVLDAFSAWPPNVVSPTSLAGPVTDFALGPGPSGPSALVYHANGDRMLATSIVPSFVETPAHVLDGDKPLLVAGVEDRFLFAGSASFAPFSTHLRVGSYQPGGLPQVEPPEVCIGSEPVGAVIPSGAGFLGAFGVPNPPGVFECNGPPYASIVSVGRYSSPSDPGSFIEFKQGVQRVTGDLVSHVAMAPASFGAWVVYQTAGLDAEVPPPVFAFRVDAQGDAYPDPTSPIDVAVSPEGTFSAVVAAALGDSLAVAWIDSLDPSAPTIHVQIVRPDLSLGPATSIATNALWYTGRLRMIGSLSGATLLLSWESMIDDQWQRALGRIDCTRGR